MVVIPRQLHIRGDVLLVRRCAVCPFASFPYILRIFPWIPSSPAPGLAAKPGHSASQRLPRNFRAATIGHPTPMKRRCMRMRAVVQRLLQGRCCSANALTRSEAPRWKEECQCCTFDSAPRKTSHSMFFSARAVTPNAASHGLFRWLQCTHGRN